VPYLFGASPAVCKSFLCGQETPLAEFDANTYFERFGTSLRMGDIGYQNNKEEKSGIKANYDSLDAYVDSLTCAINKPCQEYENIGVVVDGRYEQLNANILQIENEYYSTIRPKQVLEDNEKPSLALKRRGVRYVELRSLDVNAFDPLGIHEHQLYFLEAFLIFCLLHDSPPINSVERRFIYENELLAAHRGREPGLFLHRDGEAVELRVWAEELCAAMEGVCDVLDTGESDQPYSRALAAQCAAVRDPQLTPSARMLAEMRENKEGFFAFALRMSQKHKRYFDSLRLSRDREQFFVDLAERSLQEQRDIEASDRVSFDEYLRQYFAQA
jgi:glutamate--cysteine ligase